MRRTKAIWGGVVILALALLAARCAPSAPAGKKAGGRHVGHRGRRA